LTADSPSCVKEEIPFSLEDETLNLTITIDASKIPIKFEVMNRIEKSLADKLADFIRQIYVKMQNPRLFNTLKYLDNSFPQICVQALKKVHEPIKSTDIKEDLKKSEETKETQKTSSENPEDNSSNEESNNENGSSESPNSNEEDEKIEEEKETSSSGTDNSLAVDIYKSALKVRILTDGILLYKTHKNSAGNEKYCDCSCKLLSFASTMQTVQN